LLCLVSNEPILPSRAGGGKQAATKADFGGAKTPDAGAKPA